MKSKSIIAIVLLVLMLQPIAAGFTAGLEEFTSIAEPKSIVAPSQEPGSRLEPGDYTNHVVFAIDGDSEFADMGWPGLGTSGDPYTIEGLNITADVSATCIQIWNTDAYFIIRDCFISQGSGYPGIYLANTTHATIEYTTVYSAAFGIYADNANNTMISHTFVQNDDGSCLGLHYSQHSYIEWSEFYSTEWVALESVFSHHLTSINNVYRTDSNVPYSVLLGLQNYTMMSFDTITATGTNSVGLYAAESHFLSLSDLSVTGDEFGMEAVLCPNAVVTRCDVTGTGSGTSEAAATFNFCDGLTVEDSFFTSPYTHGVEIENTVGATFTGNTIDDVGYEGLYLQFCSEIEVRMCTITNIGNNAMVLFVVPDSVVESTHMSNMGNWGMYMFQADRSAFSDIHIENVADVGIYIQFTLNGTFLDSSITQCGGRGIYMDDSPNWYMHGNAFSEISDSAIDIESSNNITIDQNSFTNLDAEAIQIQTSDDSRITQNTITHLDGLAIDCTSTNRIGISSNVLTDCTDGISLLVGINASIISNSISGTWGNGIILENLVTPRLADNILDANRGTGISIENINQGKFEDNTMTDCGFSFISGTGLLSYNQTMTGNTVNSEPIYYGWNVNSVSLDASAYGQIILGNCTFIDITSGEISRSTTGIQLFYCTEVDVSGVTLSGQLYAARVDYSINVTFAGSTIDGYHKGDGILLFNSFRFSLMASQLSNVYGSGLAVYSSDNFTVNDCHFEDIDGNGVYSETTNLGRIIDSEFINATYGIRGTFTFTLNMSGNHIKWCEYGIYTSVISDGNFASFNNIHDNEWGMYLYDSYSWIINNNTIRWNEVGLEFDTCVGETVFFNIFAGNYGFNGVDDGSNAWDNHLDTGNWWDDYTPPGTYSIDGPGPAVDNFPMQYVVTEPMINEPPDLYYAEGSTGNTLSWIVLDDSLRNWELTIDGSVWAADAWNLVDLTVDVDGLAYGTHNVVVTVWDVDQNSVSDSLQIHVYDDTPPAISSQPHAVAFVDGSGQTVMWEASDAHPDTYTVYMDGDSFATGSWSSGAIEIGIDGQTEGEHVFNMVVRDLDGNTASDTVLVLFIDDNTNPTVDSPEDITYTHGSTGNSIIWSPSDDNPSLYSVAIDGELLSSAEWGGSRVVVVVDGLDVGEYEFELTVYDGSGNSQSDSVIVTVEAVIPSIPPPIPIDPAVLLLIAAIAGGAVVIILVVYILRKKRAG